VRHATGRSDRVCGGRVKTGRVFGASDRYGAAPTEQPVSIADFAATVYHAPIRPDPFVFRAEIYSDEPRSCLSASFRFRFAATK